MATRKNQSGKEPISSRVYCDDDDDSDTSDTEDSSKRKIRSSQPIHVPKYSQDDLEEGDEDEEDEENEFDEDDVQDSVMMGAHHRDTPMYNLSSYPPPRYSSCPRPGPRGLPSPPTPIPSPMSGEWRSPYHSLSFPHSGEFPQGISTGSQPRPPRPAQASPPYIDPVSPHGGPVSARVSTRPPPLIDPVGPSRGPGSTGLSTRLVTTTASSGGSSQSRVSDEIDPTTWLVIYEVPGGPIDGSVIPSFLGHIAYHFWHGYNRPTLKIFKGEKILNKLKMWYKDMDDVGGRVTRGGNDRPRVHDWIPPSFAGPTSVLDRLRQVRERLDRFTELEVNWEPFGHGQQGIVPRTIYSGWIMHRNLQESYMPDRCIRQSGYVQSIPRSPMSLDDAFRGPRTTQYFVQHSAVDTLSTWKRFPEPACLNLTRWRPNIGDIVGECEDGYLEWYMQYSHPFLLPTTDPSAVSTPARSSQDYWMNELRKLTRDLIRKVKVSDRDLADEYDEKLQDTMIRYYKAP
ncbi:OLC1v1031758C1 [Oldenlandia corymbosa var. corymbosa]|uniref:OLC1v1031758C1 n=1 Tax=Oldenlandia corymbosa var. corymbosa TaxID=529605 RepID=A0AAV1CM58_OLDCO|nr:OLC1v1031758C1 [Oldenlandia corymbosa var. corymbosa]